MNTLNITQHQCKPLTIEETQIHIASANKWERKYARAICEDYSDLQNIPKSPENRAKLQEAFDKLKNIVIQSDIKVYCNGKEI